MASSASRHQPLYLEKKLAEKIGVPREQLAELRKQVLPKKQTWTEGRETILTQGGLARLLEVLRATSNAGVPETDFSDCLLNPPEKKEPGSEEQATETVPATNGAIVELSVLARYKNKRLLKAIEPESGAVVDVRVPNNENFVPKMRLRARPVPGRADVYQLEGRCPRSRGRY